MDFRGKFTFLHTARRLNEAQTGFARIASDEETLRLKIGRLLQDDLLAQDLKPGYQNELREFSGKCHHYLQGTTIMNEELNRLFGAMDALYYMLDRRLYLRKKQLLHFAACLAAGKQEKVKDKAAG